MVLQQLREGVLTPIADLSGVLRTERELGFGELLATTWTAFAKDWVTILTLTLLVALPANFILAALEPGEDASLRDVGRYLRTVWNLEMVIGVFAVLGIAYTVSERLEGRAATLGAALTHAARRYFAGLWTGLLASVILGLLTLALIVPGIMWFNYYAFATCVVSLRGVAGLRALGLSKAIVKGRWWNVALKLIGLTVLVIIPSALVAVPLAFAPDSAATTFLGDVVIDLVCSFATVGTIVLFLNLEAVDRFTGRGVPAPPGN